MHNLKSLRESLCLQQVELDAPVDVRVSLMMLIEQIDYHRPLGSDGKHDNRHTATCGCEDKNAGVG